MRERYKEIAMLRHWEKTASQESPYLPVKKKLEYYKFSVVNY